MSYQRNKENLLEYLLQNEGKPEGITWKELSLRFMNSDDPRKSNDVWRYFLKQDKNITVIKKDPRILIYDIETSRALAAVWWTGKQYVGHNQLKSEPAIITIAWKWFGENNVYTVEWDDGCDKEMLADFLKEYNKADLVIGQNNLRFDNRWINARAMKHNLDVNTKPRSLDLMKENKRLFRLPSYSMAYVSRYMGTEGKLQHGGIKMWDDIQWGTPKEKKESMKKMVDYNVQDIVATEDMYLRLRKYIGNTTHVGVFQGKEKWTCPTTGSEDVQFYKTDITRAGTIQRLMKSNKTGEIYRISNRQYLAWKEDGVTSVPTAKRPALTTRATV